MIKRIFLSCILLLSIQTVNGQIGIGTITPDGSSILDISSTERGFLFPRMTTIQRDAVINPAKGLTIYNLDEDCLQVNSGTTSSPDWSCVSSTPSSTVVNDCNIEGFEGVYVKDAPLEASNKFSVTIVNNSFNSVDIAFFTSDLVLSGVDGVSVNAVDPPSASIIAGDSQLVEYSLTGIPVSTGSLTGVWTKLSLNCTKVVDVVKGHAVFTLPQTAIVLSTNDNTPIVEDFQGVVDNLSNQLTVNIPYTSGKGTYEAYNGIYIPNNAGTDEGGDVNSFRLTYPAGTFASSGSITATIEVDDDGVFNAKKQGFGSQATIASLDFQVNGNSEGNINLDVIGGIGDRNYSDADHKFIYIPVTADDGEVWLNNNLGANYSNVNHPQFNPNLQAIAHNDHHAYGSLFQWGRYSDGHELITYSSSTVGAPVTTTTSAVHSPTTTPNNTTFYLGDDSPESQDHNWLDLGVYPNATEDGLWQGETDPNNPCPDGFRVPTETEMGALISAESITDYTTAASSNLAFSTPGGRAYSTGVLNNVGNNGYYWTSTPSHIVGTTNSKSYEFAAGGFINHESYSRADGFGVRCIKD